MARAGESQPSRHAQLVLAEVDSLPTLPTVAARLIQLGSDEDAEIKEIVRLISSDPTLTGKVLSLCRRAELGLGSKVTTVDRAVVLLGIEAVRALALSVHVLDWSQRTRVERSTAGGEQAQIAGVFDRTGFWQHSLSVAICAELLCREHRISGVRPEEAFVAGLVHDIGKLVLDLVLPQAYEQVIQMADQRQGDIALFERSCLGLDHHSAGKHLAERWGLPAPVRDVIWLHGQPHEALPSGPNKTLVAVVTLADALCREMHIGWSGNLELPSIEPMCDALGLPSDRVRALTPKLHDALADRSRDLGLSDEPSTSLIVESITAANHRLSRMNAVLARRSRTAKDQTKVLETLRAFHDRVRPEMDAVACLHEIVRSASGLLGEGRYATVFRSRIRAEDPWFVAVFEDAGRPLTTRMVEHAPDEDEYLGRGCEDLDGAMRVARWLDRNVPEFAGTDALSVVPLLDSDHATGILVHDRQAASRRLAEGPVAALHGVWRAALAAAVERDAAHQLGDELARANRDLVGMQQRLTESEAMVRLGELTAGAAHELNNPLTVIRGRTQALALKLQGTEDAKNAKAASEAADQLAKLVHRLHLIGRPPAPCFGAVSVVDLVQDAIAEARRRSHRGEVSVVPIRIQIDSAIEPVRLDRELAQEALLEVVVNAIEATRHGAIEVRVQTDPSDDRLMLRVIDDGPGLSEHARRHALDPFFSEKPAGRQSGLGLATAHSLIRLHGGTISLGTRADGKPGAEVTIALPGWRWREECGSTAAA